MQYTHTFTNSKGREAVGFVVVGFVDAGRVFCFPEASVAWSRIGRSRDPRSGKGGREQIVRGIMGVREFRRLGAEDGPTRGRRVRSAVVPSALGAGVAPFPCGLTLSAALHSGGGLLHATPLRFGVPGCPLHHRGWSSQGNPPGRLRYTPSVAPRHRLEGYLQRLCSLLYMGPLHPSSAHVAHLLQDFLGTTPRVETLARLQRSRPERELRQALQVPRESIAFSSRRAGSL